MAKVNFNLRRTGKEPYSIYLIYRLDSDKSKLQINTKLKVFEKHWNNNKWVQRYRSVSKRPEFDNYNGILDKWESAVNDVLTRVRLKKVSLTKQQFKEEVVKEMKGGYMNVQSDVMSYFKQLIELKKKANLSKATIKEYNNGLNHLKAYQASKLKGRKIFFNDINAAFLIDYNEYLFGLGLSTNTVNKVTKRLRTILRDAELKGLYNLKDYKLQNTRVKSIKQPKFFISYEDIEKVLDLKLSNGTKLDRVRDRFIVQVYTGLRFADLKSISKKVLTKDANSGKTILRLKNSKTNIFVTIPIKDVVLNTLKKYDDWRLPKISNVKFNEYLKELCKKAEVNSLVTRNENGKQVNYQKHEVISSHDLRRGFATNLHLQGLPISTISTLMGHTGIAMTMGYICLDGKQNLDIAIQSAFFA